MPYSSREDMPASLQGIDPPITAAQGSMIANWAEKMEAADVENAWAVALSQFKKLYVSQDGSWARKEAPVNENIMAQTLVPVGEGQVSLLKLVEVYRAVSEPSDLAQATSVASAPAIEHGYLDARTEEERRRDAEGYEHATMRVSAGSEVTYVGPADRSAQPVATIGELPSATMGTVPTQEKEAEQTEAAPLMEAEAMDEETKQGDSPEIVYLDEAGTTEEVALAETGFQETRIGHAVGLAEGVTDWDGVGPLKLNAVLVKPGPGNKEDNRYYPAEMLQEYAPVFEGGKMYPTDHKREEKSAATECADIIKSPIGFTDEGGILAEVGIFDPTFARKAYNRALLGTLHNLHISIIGTGETRRGKIGEAEYDVVQSITAGSADFVTQAGAGGHAVGLAENEEPQVEEPVVEPETEPEPVEPETEPENEETMDTEQVQEHLNGLSGVPKAVLTRLAERKYDDAAAIDEAVKTEIKYIKEITQSGKPVGQSEEPTATPKGRSNEEHQTAITELYKSLGVLH